MNRYRQCFEVGVIRRWNRNSEWPPGVAAGAGHFEVKLVVSQHWLHTRIETVVAEEAQVDQIIIHRADRVIGDLYKVSACAWVLNLELNPAAVVHGQYFFVTSTRGGGNLGVNFGDDFCRGYVRVARWCSADPGRFTQVDWVQSTGFGGDTERKYVINGWRNFIFEIQCAVCVVRCQYGKLARITGYNIKRRCSRCTCGGLRTRNRAEISGYWAGAHKQLLTSHPGRYRTRNTKDTIPTRRGSDRE